MTRETALRRVRLAARDLGAYAEATEHDVLDEVRELAADLRGLRLVQVNSTASGGGVAELLQSLLPLELGLGLDVEWRLLCPDDALFSVTKHLHNALQGRREPMAADELALYEDRNAHCAPMLGTGWDVALIHDPQPAALRRLAPDAALRWLWRCHIDTSDPEPGAWSYLRPVVEGYDRVVFTVAEFVPPDLDRPVDLIPPAIDPLSSKNSELSEAEAARVLVRFGIDPGRPVVVQVARFDPWKGSPGGHRRLRAGKAARPGRAARAGRIAGHRRSRRLGDPRAGERARRRRAGLRHPVEPGRGRAPRGQRVPAGGRGCRAEEPSRGLRPHGLGGLVEGHARGRRPRRGHPAPSSAPTARSWSTRWMSAETGSRSCSRIPRRGVATVLPGGSACGVSS